MSLLVDLNNIKHVPFLTRRFNKIAIQGRPHMAVDKEAISLFLSVPAVILCVTRLN